MTGMIPLHLNSLESLFSMSSYFVIVFLWNGLWWKNSILECWIVKIFRYLTNISTWFQSKWVTKKSTNETKRLWVGLCGWLNEVNNTNSYKYTLYIPSFVLCKSFSTSSITNWGWTLLCHKNLVLMHLFPLDKI